MAFPSPLVILSVVAVAMAALAFVATSHRGADDRLQPVSEPSVSSTPTATAPVRPTPKPAVHVKRKRPAVKRSQVYVEVFNNSGVTGLAGRTATQITDAGWNVVGTDNWYGTIPASTVYYPPRLHAAAQALGRDLGVRRILPAVEPMRFDRLTLILTADRA